MHVPLQVFLPRPPLARGDGPIMRMRGWIAQFYARGLPKVALALEGAAAAASGGQEETAASGGKKEGFSESSTLRQRVAAKQEW